MEEAMTLLDLNLKRDEPKNTCKGKVYKCNENVFINSRGDIIYKTTMRLMKRMSCSGCKYCGGLEE